MDRVAFTSVRRPFLGGLPGHCPHNLHGATPPCRPVPTSVASRRGIVCCAALSDGGPQGTSAALNPKLMDETKSQIERRENAQPRAAPSVKSDRERVDGGEPRASGSKSSWDEWLRHFDAMDDLAEDAAHYQVELNTAVRQERYGDAARYKRRLQDIQASDTVAAVQRQLQDALAEEQYGAAAELRDRGMVGLAGWWAGKDGPDDFQGHLLHVKSEFGRWTGRIYLARDIAAMNGWRENRLLQRLDTASDRASVGRGLDGSTGGLGGGTIGTPMMEVFVRQQPGGGAAQLGQASASEQQQQQHAAQQQQQLVPGLLVHQAVALRPPAQKGDGGRGPKGGAAGNGGGGGAAKLNPASVVRLSIHVARDGSARISVLPPKPIKSEFNSWEEEEMRATMAALAGDGLKATLPRNAAAAGARASTSAAVDGFQRPEDDEEEDVLTELTRVPAQVIMQGRDRFTFAVLGEGAAAAARLDAAGGGNDGGLDGSGSSVDLPRWAAVPIDEDDSSGDENEAAAAQRRASGRGAAAAAAAAEVPVVEVQVELADADKAVAAGPSGRRTFLEAADEAAARGLDVEEEDEDEGVDEDEDGGLEVSLDMLSTGYGKVDAVATSVTDAEEQRILIEIPVGRLIRQQQRAQQQQEQREREQQRLASGGAAASSSATASGRGAGKDTFDRLAERVAQLQAARAGRRVPPEHLAKALRALAQRLVNGELAADGSSSATATVPSAAAIEAQQAAAAAAARLKAAASPLAGPIASTSSSSAKESNPGPMRIAYNRIPTNLPRSDPFCGLYLGAFGPHGPELIQLNRTMQDGEEMVCATKVTGDPNVPAGEVSFRAKIGRRHRLDSRDVYPEDLGIVARYKGEGRVAMAGYKSSRWVDGELLVFAAGSSPATGGAELGFVWSVPGEKRFLILLNKLDLKECEK